MLDDRSPIYRQIAERIKADVMSGVLKGDEKVMSTNQYATTFRINPATAAKAFAQLVDDGILYKRRGVGMFVAPGAPDRLRAEGRESFFAEVVDPVAERARALGIPLEDVVARLRDHAARDRTARRDGAAS